MTTITTPGIYAAAPAPVRATSIVEVFAATVRTHAGRPALRWRDGDGWSALTWAEYADAVAEVASGLRDLGMNAGDRVGILSANRPEWHVADLAILGAGLVSVPVYATSSASQVAYVLGHSGARVCFAENADQVAKILLRRGELPDLERVVVIDGGAGLDDPFLVSLGQLRSTAPEGARRPDALAADIDSSSLATIVYTSGTTGPPKGTMITHANLMATMGSLTALIEIRPTDRFLSFLPLSHITERCISNFGQIVGGAETWFARSIATLAEDLQACRPTILFAVPRVWEKFRDRVLERIAEQSPPVRHLAERYLTAAAGPQDKRSAVQAAELRVLHATVGRSIRRQLGLDRARILTCGAAPVHPDLLRWFHQIGLPIAEGYGQTEVSLCTSTNTPGDTVIGTVGRPIPGVEVSIAADGEILVRGDNVCAGYWRDPAATAELIDADGWLHTGDLGESDETGRLSVTGRKKDLIISAYGKNIAPAELETALRMDPLIAQAVVVGDRRPFLTALLTLDADAVADWARQHERTSDVEALVDDPVLHDAIAAAVERVNATHSHAEGIRRWRILPHDLTMAGDELTPTLKVRRHIVTQRWTDLIEEMYSTAHT